ncbi:hypothetical protein KC909_01395 [Candidatus Dojkabacteria bacterium]|uniref:DHHA1 domain-containing protein n=1 Tax=Candidatus Dojkabacteria bacterium TaxID=2099670 RepID=A0A955L5D8_9BACT|nr:hypothetical protein [Candidatus Dojkabacteria bacterium]
MPTNISIGYDPAPVGKYPISKILTDSDLDGVISGAILKTVYPEAQILQGEATGMEQGIYTSLVDKDTVIADLKYIDGCGLYFDHHESNKPDSENFPGRWMNLNSAAEVCYQYYRECFDLTKFAPYIDDIGKFDMALFSLDEFLNPNMILKLGQVIDRNDFAFNIALIEEIVNGSVESAFNLPSVAGKIDNFFAQRELIFKHISENSYIKDSFAFVDVSGYSGTEKISGPLLTSQFPDVDGVVAFKKRGKEANSVKVRFYGNSFNPNRRDIDFLSIAKELSKRAGGHRGACGFLLDESQTKDQVIADFLKIVNK